MIEAIDLFQYAGMLDQRKKGFFEAPGGELTKGRRMIEKRLAMGLCISCKKPREGKAQRCRACMKKAVTTNAATKRKARLSGVCQRCRQPWSGKSVNCNLCLETLKEKWARRSSGLYCTRCASHRDGPHKACSKCRSEMRKSVMKRRAGFSKKGLCVQCAKDTCAGDGKYCMGCTLKTAARRWLGDPKRWQELLALFERQNRQCAYTGEPLVIGGNASVDHKSPRSKGGQDDISNLQWTSWIVNRVKTDIPHEDFLAMCRTIADRFPVE